MRVSVADTVRLVRLYTDERSGAYLSTDEVVSLISEEWVSSIWPRVAQRCDAWYATTATSAVTSSVGTVGVPGDLHRAKRLVLVYSDTNREDVLPLVERERASIESRTWGRGCPKRYVLHGDTCSILPTPTESVTAQWVYLPVPDSDEIVGPEGARKCVALAAAIAVRDLQGEDTRNLERRLDRALVELDRQSGQLYQDESPRVISVDPDGVGYPEDERYLPRP